VCGPLVGGAFLAQVVATELDVEFYHTERVVTTDGGGLNSVNYRLPNTLRPRIGGKQVAIVDDAINAGSAVRTTCLELQASGARVAAVGALLVVGRQAAELAAGSHAPLEGIGPLPRELGRPGAWSVLAARVPVQPLIE